MRPYKGISARNELEQLADSIKRRFLAEKRVLSYDEYLDELPDAQREALVLHHVLGMTVSEVADQLEAPQETVRSRLRLGKDRLRQLLSLTPDRMVG
jgi:RNA polymerase sigma factor (sigma-70 family)